MTPNKPTSFPRPTDIQTAASMHPVIANPTLTGMNVITKDEYTKLAKFVFDRIVDVLSNSYGPYGSMSLINRAGYRFSTKDGWRILMYSAFNENIYYRSIHRMIFDVCEQMNDTVGDGTTTVILIANRIYDALIKVLPEIEAMDLPPRDVFNAFDRVVAMITEKIKEKARPFTADDVRNIAKISTNDDEVITECLCKLYERDPDAEIQIMESNKLGVSIEEIDGLKIPVEVLDRIYVNNKIEKCCDAENALFLVFNHKIGETAINKIVLPLEAALIQRGTSQRLVVIAPSYEESMLVGFWLKKAADEYRSKGFCQTVLVKYRSTVMGTAGADDLAILLDTHPIDGRMVAEISGKGQCVPGLTTSGRVALRNHEAAVEIVTGTCEKAKLGYEQMSFFSGMTPTPNVLDAQKLAVKQDIEACEDSMTVTEKQTSMKLSNLKKRLARLEMKMSVIYYGADSAFDKEWLHDTIEDGVRALESARRSGIVKGSQFDLLNSCKECYDTVNDLDAIIIKSIITGIQETLTQDLYSKSKIFNEFIIETKTPLGERLTASTAANIQRYASLAEAYRNGGLGDVLLGLLTSDIDSFNLITMRPDPNLITSAETDICALKASIELLKILVAGNQLLMVNE